MRLLNREESWLFLYEKVFGEKPCPPQLEEAGEKIADKCDSLPLTIITIADLLTGAPESLWIEVATYKKHQLFVDAYDEISKVLYPSYDDLNEDMKLCFLYMEVFPQNFRILRSKLFNLWVAEKIIDYSDNWGDLESSAFTSLQYLDCNSIIMVFQTCGLHSWHFCHREARKNNFFFILDSYKDSLGEGIENQSRLSIHNNVLFSIREVYNSIEANCASFAHSLLCFGSYHQYPVQVCVGLKLLKKLDALNIRFYEFPWEILELVKLRYLALTCNGLLPHSISNLEKLQFLIVHRHLSIKRCGALSDFPIEIWDMKKLKYLHVVGNDLPDLGNTFLHKLSTLLGVGKKSCSANVLGRTPNLNKLNSY